MRPLGEELIEMFNDDFLKISKHGPLKADPVEGHLKRTKDFGLELEVTLPGHPERETSEIPAGSFYESTDSIEFKNIEDTVYRAVGLIKLSHSSNLAARNLQTTYKFSVHKMEMERNSSLQPSYVIEWVGNLASRLIGNSSLKSEDEEGCNLVFGHGESAVSIFKSVKLKGSSRILHISVGGNDIYIVNTKDSEPQKEKRSGYILYRGAVSSSERDKIRKCLSFVLGLPIVIFGYTEYADDDMPLRMKSFPVYSLGGRFFGLSDLPPYPIGDGYFRNNPNISALQQAINSLYINFEKIKFDDLYWAYWQGACASAAMSAVYFGGLCEQMQRVDARMRAKKGGGTLIPEKQWKAIEKSLLMIIESLDADNSVKNIYNNKIKALNQLPQNIALNRMLADLGLSISNAERNAWRHRNSAAHGSLRGTDDEVVLNSRLLRLMFHRLLAAITGCSEFYVDYYNLHFPIRRISEEIPERLPSC